MVSEDLHFKALKKFWKTGHVPYENSLQIFDINKNHLMNNKIADRFILEVFFTIPQLGYRQQGQLFADRALNNDHFIGE